MTDRQLAAVAAYGLPGAASVVWPATALSAEDWDRLLAAVQREWLTGLLVAVLDAGDLPATREQTEAARVAYLQQRAKVLILNQHLLRASEILSSVGLLHLVLKGPAHACLDQRQPQHRAYKDIDILVETERYREAIALLQAHGYRSLVDAEMNHVTFEARFRKGRVLTAPGGAEVELHRLLLPSPYGLSVETGPLFAGAETMYLQGAPILALGREERFLHACVHAVVGGLPPKYRSLRDIVLMAGRADLDWKRVQELATTWKVMAPLRLSTDLAWSRLGLPDPDVDLSWIRQARQRYGERILLTVSSWRGHHRPQAQRIATLAATPGLANKWDQVRHMVTPGRRYLRDNGYDSYPSWWLFLARSLAAIGWRLAASRSSWPSNGGPSR